METRLERVKGGFGVVKVYEVYGSAAERRKATRGAKLRQPTGLARGFILVDWREETMQTSRTWTAVTELGTNNEPGDEPHTLVLCDVGYDYSHDPRVRSVGWRYVPETWRKALLCAGWFKVVKGILYDIIPE